MTAFHSLEILRSDADARGAHNLADAYHTAMQRIICEEEHILAVEQALAKLARLIITQATPKAA